jgi:hypothetical protein
VVATVIVAVGGAQHGRPMGRLSDSSERLVLRIDLKRCDSTSDNMRCSAQLKTKKQN